MPRIPAFVKKRYSGKQVEDSMQKLIYYAPASFGGLFNYAQEQADALAGEGISVTLLCSPEFKKRPTDRYSIKPNLTEHRTSTSKNKISRALNFLRIVVSNMAVLRREIEDGGFRHVMFVSFAEYFAPIWSRGFRKLAKGGVIFGAVIQEPVRNFRAGPLWWHRRSISDAYSFLKYAFVHDNVVLDTGKEKEDLSTIVIPYGPHRFPDPSEDRNQVRQRLGVPVDAILLLSFGHIRDDKNLDHCVQALKDLPDVYLLVAGKRSANSQRPESYYMTLAESIGVSKRCKWIIEYVTEEEAANLFAASDLVLLTYSSSFRSASGVLHLAARYEKQSIVSSGQGSLKSVVIKSQIGIWIEPDEPNAIVSGIQNWIKHHKEPDWEKYRNENSWHQNARLVKDAMINDEETED